MKLVFVACIVRNRLCIIYGFLSFFQKPLFTENYFLIAEINLTTGVHCRLVLFDYLFTDIVDEVRHTSSKKGNECLHKWHRHWFLDLSCRCYFSQKRIGRLLFKHLIEKKLLFDYRPAGSIQILYPYCFNGSIT